MIKIHLLSLRFRLLIFGLFFKKKLHMTDLDKMKIAYEVMRDLETRDDIKPSIVNNIVVVKNLLANDIAFAVTFGNNK